jgi:pyrimidine deaminase RibD-like protein
MPDSREFMKQAVVVARSGTAEDTRAHPRVGAVLVKSGEVLATAYRGELSAGEHAEYTLLQRKVATLDLRNTTLFTTLEPCTSRNHPKKPCADWVIERGVRQVVVGMLDPNPTVYEQGVRRLRDAGTIVDFFPADLKDEVRADNELFIQQFRASPDLSGSVTFNFTHNNGRYTLGHGDLTFETRWDNASNVAIHVYTDGTGLRGLGLALSARSFDEIGDASAYDVTSRVQTPREGDFLVLQNGIGYYAAAQVLDVRARSHGDPYDALTLRYRINVDGGPHFG